MTDERLPAVALADDLADLRLLVDRADGADPVQVHRLLRVLVAALQAYCVREADCTTILLCDSCGAELEDEPVAVVQRIIQ